ncbi:MAG: hypothetical protein IID42_09255 [Planctomycetes bacterium]|nr:hypothetical protein [Planctomycetota bacterium]
MGHASIQTTVSAGGDARLQAETTIDHLGRRGYTDFGDLLDMTGTNDSS